jgi:hypothetical protein
MKAIQNMLLIDADILVYRVGFAVEKERTNKLDMAKYNINRAIGDMAVATGVSQYQCYLTGKENFRDQVATIIPYKGNREGQKKPSLYQELRDYLQSDWKAEVIKGMEADDAIGIAAYDHFWEEIQWPNKKTIICTIDKDLNMIPGMHYNFVKKKLEYIDYETANRFFFQQILTGDATDNIRGLKGYGDAKAKKVIKDCKTEDEFRTKILNEYQSRLKETDGYFTLPLKGCEIKLRDRESVSKVLRELAQLLWIRRVKDGAVIPFVEV